MEYPRAQEHVSQDHDRANIDDSTATLSDGWSKLPDALARSHIGDVAFHQLDAFGVHKEGEKYHETGS